MKSKLPKLEFMMQLGIILLVIKVSCNSSQILPYSERLDTVLSVLSVLALGISMIRKRYPKKILAGYVIIGLLALYSVFVTGNYGFLITIILGMAMYQVEFDHVIRHLLHYETIFFTAHTCYSIIGWILWKIPYWQDVYGVDRCSFGFVHPNMFAMYVFHLILMWVWLNDQKIKNKHIIGIAAIASVVYFFTKTRTSFLITIILCLLLILTRTEKKEVKKLLATGAKYIMPLMSVVTIGLSITYRNGNFLSKIADQLLNARIRLGGYAFENYGMTLFGQDLTGMEVTWDDFWGLTEHTFDNIYTAAAMNDGLIWLILIAAAFYKLAQKENIKINLCLIMWSLYGVTEVHGLNALMCFPILLVVLLYSEEKEEETINGRKQITKRNFADFKR